MVKKPTKLVPKGAESAQELYILIGVALSWWESSEDMILGLFRQLCDDIEPVAVGSFIKAPRNVRYSMLNLAMQTYSFRFEDGEVATVSAALRGLDNIAPIRNEIAHGHVAQISDKVDGVLVAEGNYLMPSFNEGTFHERSFRYHHTPQSIEAFIEQLRKQRVQIIDVSTAMITRTQNRIYGSGNGAWFIQTVRRIARLEVYGLEAVKEMKQVIGNIDEFEAG